MRTFVEQEIRKMLNVIYEMTDGECVARLDVMVLYLRIVSGQLVLKPRPVRRE